ncbi:MAG TPA: zinc ribbon domain-containing protein [Candidatus Bathyarchaeia archaeon]|nr:zinc ribbon domain-containing protein [Candidatus Bathyarchaeia archaeon]
MSQPVSYCPNCGSTVRPGAEFCANCGTRLTAQGPVQQTQPSYYQPIPAAQPPVSTGAYKAIIAVLLVIIILLGVLWYSSSGGHVFQFGPSRYQLTTPPNLQSTQPGPTPANPPSSSPSYFTIWNACGSNIGAGCSMSGTGWREGSVPDTFDYYVSFTSTVPVTVYFFTMGQFVQYAVCNGDITCVSGYYDSLTATTSQPFTLFTLGEGCADYLAIYVASGSGTLYPDVGVSRPATSPGGPTGYCAQAGT